MFSTAGAITNSYGVRIGTTLRFNKPLQLEFSNQCVATKQCSDCGQFFPISEFHKNNRRKCKQCYNIYANKFKYKRGVCKPYNENKKCSLYFGSHIAENLLLSTFDNVNKAPMNNPGYDFVCGKGFKVDVKAACLGIGKNSHLKSGRRIQTWMFVIKHNTIPDYFALIAFDTKESLTPLHFWLVPGEILNKKFNIQIRESKLNKWSKYEKPLDKMSIACSTMKEQGVEG